MNNKSVLILGAGLMQKPAIIAAKELGYITYVVDKNPNAMCKKFADFFEPIDLKDKEAILDFAKKIKEKTNLEGVFTAGTDFSSSVSYVAENLSLPCHSYKASLNASNKYLMRNCFKENDVPSPKYIKIEEKNFNNLFIDKITNEFSFPFVVKPSDNMGARGCRLVRNINELSSSLKEALNNSRTKTALIEEYMEGSEFSIDALVYKNTLTITGFADRHIYYPPYFIETGHTMPSCVSEEIKEQVIKVFAKAVKSLGLECGAAKGDVKFTKNGVMICEVAARLSGGYMSGWTFPYASSFNLTKEALLIACGKVPTELLKNRIKLNYFSKTEEEPFELFEIPCKYTSAERAWISIPGKVKELVNYNKDIDESVKNIFPRDIKVGDIVDFPRNNVQKCGNIISLDKDYNKAIKISEQTASKCFIRLEENNELTENFLKGITKDDEESFPPSAYSCYESVRKLQINGIIPADTLIEECIPLELLEYVKSSEKDWNYLTALETIKYFDMIYKNHKEVEAERFWKALFRAGLQGIVYVCDSSK